MLAGRRHPCHGRSVICRIYWRPLPEDREIWASEMWRLQAVLRGAIPNPATSEVPDRSFVTGTVSQLALNRNPKWTRRVSSVDPPSNSNKGRVWDTYFLQLRRALLRIYTCSWELWSEATSPTLGSSSPPLSTCTPCTARSRRHGQHLLLVQPHRDHPLLRTQAPEAWSASSPQAQTLQVRLLRIDPRMYLCLFISGLPALARHHPRRPRRKTVVRPSSAVCVLHQ